MKTLVTGLTNKELETPTEKVWRQLNISEEVAKKMENLEISIVGLGFISETQLDRLYEEEKVAYKDQIILNQVYKLMQDRQKHKDKITVVINNKVELKDFKKYNANKGKIIKFLMKFMKRIENMSNSNKFEAIKYVFEDYKFQLEKNEEKFINAKSKSTIIFHIIKIVQPGLELKSELTRLKPYPKETLVQLIERFLFLLELNPLIAKEEDWSITILLNALYKNKHLEEKIKLKFYDEEIEEVSIKTHDSLISFLYQTISKPEQFILLKEKVYEYDLKEKKDKEGKLKKEKKEVFCLKCKTFNQHHTRDHDEAVKNKQNEKLKDVKGPKQEDKGKRKDDGIRMNLEQELIEQKEEELLLEYENYEIQTIQQEIEKRYINMSNKEVVNLIEELQVNEIEKIELPPKNDGIFTEAKINGVMIKDIKVDCASDLSILSSKTLELIPNIQISESNKYAIVSVNGKTPIKKLAKVKIEYKGKEVNWTMGVVESEQIKVLFGKDLIKILSISIDELFKKEIEFSKKLEDYKIQMEDFKEIRNQEMIFEYIENQENLVKEVDEDLKENADTSNIHAKIEKISLKVIDENIKYNPPKELYCIQRITDIPMKFRKSLEESRDKWIDKNYIKHKFDHIPAKDKQGRSLGEFNFRIFGKEERTKIRWLVNYAPLNPYLIDDTNLVRTRSEIISQVISKKPKIFSLIDIEDFYKQVELEEETRNLLAFTIFNERYVPVTAPQGIKSFPCQFQRILQGILQKEGCSEFSINYIDDLLVFSENMEKHVIHLKKVIQALTKYCLTINQRKLKLFCRKITFLGFILTPEGSEVDPRKVSRLINFKRPTSKKEFERIIGLMVYLGGHVMDFSERMHNLYEKLKEDKPVWNTECEETLKYVHQQLVKNFMYFPREDLDIVLITDASDYAAGAYIGNFDPKESKLYPIGFYSFSFNASQRKMPIHKKELLSCARAINNWRYILYATNFTIYMDSEAVTYILKILESKKVDKFVTNLLSQISEYTFDIKHIAGKKNIADVISRIETMDYREVMLTEQEIQETIENAHTIAHFGENNTINYIQNIEQKDIPNLKERVKEFIKKCKVCQKVSNGKLMVAPIGDSTKEIIAPFQHLQMDIMEKIESNRGFKYVLVLTDPLTGFVIQEPMFTKEAIEVAWNIYRTIGIIGKPAAFGSDLGSEFISQVLKTLEEVFNIKHIHALKNNHKSNGLCESKIRWIRETMNKLIEDSKLDPRDWDLIIFLGNIAMNARQNNNTLMSAYNYVFGHMPFKYKEYKGEITKEEIEKAKQMWINYFKNFNTSVVPLLKKLKIQRVKIINQNYHHNTGSFEEGDVCMYRNENKMNKDDTLQWIGPFKIVKKLERNNYELESKVEKIIAGTHQLKLIKLGKDQKLLDKTLNQVLEENSKRIENVIGRDSDKSGDYREMNGKDEKNKQVDKKETKYEEGYYVKMVEDKKDNGKEEIKEYKSKSGRIVRKPKNMNL